MVLVSGQVLGSVAVNECTVQGGQREVEKRENDGARRRRREREGEIPVKRAGREEGRG